MKDLVIIGGGPAAITAAIYACRQNADFKVISESVGGQAALSFQIENYTGFQLISGAELISRFMEHAEEFGIEIKDGFRVEKVEEKEDGFNVFTADGKCCSSRALIVASGARPRRLGVPGESEFSGRGVAYCATCDAPIFRGKDVAVIGGGNAALDAARQLKELAKRVFIVTINDKLEGEKILKDRVTNSPNVEVLTAARTMEIKGERTVNGIDVHKDGRTETIGVEGVFVEIGWLPSSDFIDFVSKNDKGEIIVDIDNRTSREGVYAAGDVTSVSKKQIIIASGAGASAALNAIEYLSKKE